MISGGSRSFAKGPESVFEKKLTGGGGSACFFGSEVFDSLIFLGFGKISLIFFESEDFSLIFLG